MKIREKILEQPKMMLKQSNRYCSGERLEYALYGSIVDGAGHFRVTVNGFGACAETEFWQELTCALQLFDKLVEGAVPPCVLQEIVDDQLQIFVKISPRKQKY